MEVQSFILGIGTALVIAAVVVGVVAFFKVIKLQKNQKEFEIDILNTINGGQNDADKMTQELRGEIEKVYSEIDSRYDKLKSVFSKEIDNAIKQKNN